MICPYLSSSVPSAARLQPRRASGRRGQALLALPQDRPIRLRRGDHHPLPLRRPLPALQHRPLHLPAEVGRTARHPNSQRLIPPLWLEFLGVKQRDNTARAGSSYLALDAACRDSLPMRKQTGCEKPLAPPILFLSSRPGITPNSLPPQLCATLHAAHRLLSTSGKHRERKKKAGGMKKKIQKKSNNNKGKGGKKNVELIHFEFMVAWNYSCTCASASHIAQARNVSTQHIRPL